LVLVLLRIGASDLEQLLTIIENETIIKEGLRKRLIMQIANKRLDVPSKVLEEFITASEILATPRKVNSGKMIVLTGLDKSGKETQAFNPERNPRITSLCDYLRSRSYNVLEISLPSYKNTFGSLVAAYLRKEDADAQILGELDKKVAWILWSLDRAGHVLEVEKWLESSPSNVVVCKRWTETNIAYQRANGIEEKRILDLERNIIKQTYTFVIDVSPETVLQRMHTSGEKPDKYETIEFLKKVRRNYANLHEFYPFGKIFYFDGSGSMEEVNQKLLQKLNELGF